MTLFCGVDPVFTRKLKAMILFLAGNLLSPYIFADMIEFHIGKKLPLGWQG